MEGSSCSSDGGARADQDHGGALPFGGNEAWSEIYTTRLRPPAGLQEKEEETMEIEEARED